MKTKLQIIFYSMYGHIYKMTEAVAQGARSVPDVDVKIFRVAELMPEEMLVQCGAKEIQKSFEHIPLIHPNDITDADGFIFGTPTRFGNMCAQMRHFIDQLGGLRNKHLFMGKVGSVYTSRGAQCGSQETTLASFQTSLFNLGMVVTGVPYLEKKITNLNEITGSTPYDMQTLASLEDTRTPSENELALARYQGKHVAEITRYLKQGKEVCQHKYSLA